MVINKDVIYAEQFILKRLVATYMSIFKCESSSNKVIQVDIYPPPINKMWVVPKPQDKSWHDTKIQHQPDNLVGVY